MMVELQTTEQALAYLAQMSPSQRFRVQGFPLGWVCSTILTREQIDAGQGLGLARLVIDARTGIVYVYPSWPQMAVAVAFTEFKETGINRAGRRVYPYQWRITIQRIREDDETIVYQLTAHSLEHPPEPTWSRPLSIQKATYATDPTDPITRRALSRAVAQCRRDRGVWPETATAEV